MVREVRLSWDADFPLPEELTIRDWDLDDSPFHTSKEHSQFHPNDKRLKAAPRRRPRSPKQN